MLADHRRIVKGLDVWIIPDFAARHGIDPVALQRDLENNYPRVGESDSITWAEPQWVGGENASLKYRGRELKREKMWFQREDPRSTRQFVRYYYTGWQKAVLPATACVERAPELKPMVSAIDALCQAEGYAAPNHWIITRYRDQAANIGAHYDKPKSIEPQSLIVVVKMGEVGRPFKLEWLDGRVIFEEVLLPGAAIVMTLEANLRTKHSVPVVDETVGNSGSIVARTIADSWGWEKLEKELARKLGKRAREQDD